MNTAIIVCARLKSRRVPGKIAIEINGKSVLRHLHDRLCKTGLQIIYAVPEAEYDQFCGLIKGFDLIGSNAFVFSGYDEDPLQRMYEAAKHFDVEMAIRVTHDKIFIDTDAMFHAISEARRLSLHYVYNSALLPGTGFEIIAFAALEEAAKKYKNVEHISYAIRAVTKRQADLGEGNFTGFQGYRLLIDFPEDIQLMTRIFGILGDDCTLMQVKNLLLNHGWLADINKMPLVTIYTCAFNAEAWIEMAMGSVSMQKNFRDYEYILVDDCSSDKTAFLMSKFAAIYPNVKYIRNAKNVGLASSSNVALENARGQFIVRMDADDYFTSKTAVRDLLSTCIGQRVDVVYPGNYFGSREKVQRPDDCHHVGGALFRTRALNHIKFTDGLRNYEGLDLFKRAEMALKIGYLNQALFFYRQHDRSMSKTNLAERAKTREAIEKGHTGPLTQGG
jgi:spore coat polysaccharide biosynthesis protein SpsF (cytidylyltransferase family)